LAPPQANPERAPSTPATQPPTPAGSLLVQAGTFKSQENAERARRQLASIAPVDVAPITAGGETFFRVRIGPFAGEGEAASALARVSQQGYTGARIVRK
jgi:rare lipoprotein A